MRGVVVVVATFALPALMMSCTTEVRCADAAARDAGFDSTDMLEDVGATDADPSTPADAAGCSGFPGSLEIAPLVRVESLTTASPCLPGDAELVHLEIFRRGELVPALVEDGTCEDVLAVGPLQDGDYEIALRQGAYAVGVELMNPERCTGSESRSALYWPPLSVSVRPCRATVVIAALYCDPALGPCPPVMWPW